MLGSSPRVWGQANKWSVRSTNRGIIPTRVGTSCYVRSAVFACWDHPHACGDKTLTCGYVVVYRGSSPRVWGQVVSEMFSISAIGIIPTRVGTRTSPFRTAEKCKDHPHACGDKRQDLLMRLSRKGSSPRVWGQGCTQHRLR